MSRCGVSGLLALKNADSYALQQLGYECPGSLAPVQSFFLPDQDNQ